MDEGLSKIEKEIYISTIWIDNFISIFYRLFYEQKFL